MKGKVLCFTICVFVLLLTISFSPTAIEIKKVDNNTFFKESSLLPPWSNHSSWKDKWKEYWGEAWASVSTDGYEGTSCCTANSKFIGKGKAKTYFYHGTDLDEYTCSSDGFYNIEFLYSYDCFFRHFAYYSSFNLAAVYGNLKFTFMVYVEDEQEEYKEEKVVFDSDFVSPMDPETEFSETITIEIPEVYIPKGSRVSFQAKCYSEVYSRTYIVSRAEGKMKITGSLDKITISKMDENRPDLRITKPRRGALYENNEYQGSSGMTIIFGSIDIEVVASADTGIDRVEFYIDMMHRETINSEPYVYSWDDYEKELKPHIIYVKAVDTRGNSNADILSVLYKNNKTSLEISKPLVKYD